LIKSIAGNQSKINALIGLDWIGLDWIGLDGCLGEIFLDFSVLSIMCNTQFLPIQNGLIREFN
jgi:hypothetical protein